MNIQREAERSLIRKASSRAIGYARITQPNRQCPIPGCPETSNTFSPYCWFHALINKRTGHPAINYQFSAASLRKIAVLGWAIRDHLGQADEDKRAWQAVVNKIDAFRTDPRYKTDIATLVRRRKTWSNRFKGAVLISRRLNHNSRNADTLLAIYLGMTARLLNDNDLLLTRRQLLFSIQKIGARAAITYRLPLTEPDQYDPDREWKYQLQYGAVTQAGWIVFELIASEFGQDWFKRVDEAIAILPTIRSRSLPFINDGEQVRYHNAPYSKRKTQ